MMAPRRLVIEVIVSSVEDAIAAERGGAGRLEVVRALDRDGLTPPLDLVRDIQRAVSLPLRVMVRESDGFACRTSDERRRLAEQAAALDSVGVDGLVIGWIRDGHLDEDTLEAVLQAAPSTRATFHHAFDALADPQATLQALAPYPQLDRILTRGGSGAWASRCSTFARYAAWGAPRISVLPGGGVDAAAIRALAACGSVAEAHVGRAAREGGRVDGPVSAARVQQLCAAPA
jgi:copper homeostasis protein